ncbi:hypothetical protein HPB51_021694 [Rhipicephalus microplus]|uniref:Tick transposon n=1 Tax=Rhipicephalus microplus TaxID=6941 RepID=A0A9J6D758_RHIMP|nr:hypothetical protein HPB51_021694 [Rhipicephalus microplus]
MKASLFTKFASCCLDLGRFYIRDLEVFGDSSVRLFFVDENFQVANVKPSKVKATASKLCEEAGLHKLASSVRAARGVNLSVFFSAKTHKPEVPFRVIVSEQGTWQRLVGRYLQRSLSVLPVEDPCLIRKPQMVSEFLQQECPSEVSFFSVDVKDLYYSLPMDQVCAEAEAGKKKALIAEEFGIAASSLSTILKSKDAIGKALASGTSAKHKKVTQPVHEALDKAVYTWFVETRAKKIAFSGDIVRQKALDFACMLGIDDFKASVDRDEDRLLDQDEEIAVAWAGLQESDVPADVHISEFLQADSCLVVREEMTDADIIKSVQEDGVSSDDDDTIAQRDPALPPTSQVLDAFDIIRRCIGSQDDDEAMALLAACESRVVPSLGKKRKQAKFSDFWH